MSEKRCPYCGEELEEGYVQSARPIFYDKEERFFWFFPRKKSIKLAGSLFEAAVTKACVCKKCKVVIIKYGEEEELL